jgi:hypothetical protein
MIPVGEKAWQMLPLGWEDVKELLGGRQGLDDAPVARITIRACLMPVVVVSVKSEVVLLKEMFVTSDFWIRDWRS